MLNFPNILARIKLQIPGILLSQNFGNYNPLANGISPHGSHHNQRYGEARSWAEALEKGEFILGYNTEFITELAKSVLRPAYSTARNNDGTKTVGWEGKR